MSILTDLWNGFFGKGNSDDVAVREVEIVDNSEPLTGQSYQEEVAVLDFGDFQISCSEPAYTSIKDITPEKDVGG